MKIISASIHALRIPFNFHFGHFLKIRIFSDSIVMKLTTDAGICGYGEGVARPYVTGEKAGSSIEYITRSLMPGILGKELAPFDAALKSYRALESLQQFLPSEGRGRVRAWNAAACAVELALIDCLLKDQNLSLAHFLPPKTDCVYYTGVLTSGNIKGTIELAERAKREGFRYIKMKVGRGNDVDRIKAVRDIVGPEMSIRLDANGAFNVKTAISFTKKIEQYRIDALEQPVKQGCVADLAAVKAGSPIPIMADESIVTMDDAMKLIERRACDYLNLRIAKCGGIFKTLFIADAAEKAGMKIQLGCLVGETAILSAAGRHVAAAMPQVTFVEGSYSTILLTEDISREPVVFSPGGGASLIAGTGLGITINESILQKYSRRVINCN